MNMDYNTFKTQYGLRLDPQQEAAVRSTGMPVLLLAVPGSGKTTVLIARLGYLIACCGVAPSQILTMTYTVAATADMRQRFAACFGDQPARQIAFRTINGVCAWILRLYEQRTGRQAFSLVSDEGQLNAIVGELYRKEFEEFATESDLRTLRTQITYIKNRMLRDEELDELQLDGALAVAPIYRAYCKTLRARRLMDFDDQLVYALQILHRCPDILSDLRRRFPVLCVDEAQDTSLIQHRIIRLLAGDGRGLFMVGDEDQSIYGFRAACPEALMEFETTYPGARILFLERNYRSTPQIVAAASSFIQHNTARRPKRMIAVSPSGAPVRVHRCRDREDQYRALVNLAQEMAQGKYRGTIAVLYRDNDTALPLIDLLEQQQIPYRTRQMEGAFFSSRIVRDILDILTLANNPRDTDAFLRIYYKFNIPIARLHAQNAANQAHMSGGDVWTALRHQELSRRADGQVQSLISHLRLLLHDSASRALERIVQEMGYGEYLDRNYLDRSRLTILQMLAKSVRSVNDLPARLQSLQQLVRDGAGTPESRFILSTIHSSKGLEYDRVVLADVADGILPKLPLDGTMATPEEAAALEEERRLFYVGMTRARKELTLIRFDRFDLRSSFLDLLFPSDSPALPKAPAAPSFLPKFSLPAGYSTPKKQDSKLEILAKEFYLNTPVRHKTFGRGVIIQRDEETVVIRFDSGAEKRFNLYSALRVNALELA